MNSSDNYKNILYLFLFVLFAISCKESKQKYFYFNFTDKTLKDIIVTGDVKKEKENGLWAIYNVEDTALLTQGNYLNGLKNGLWIYKLSNNNTDTVLWKSYEDKHKRLLLNLPNDWDVITYDNFFFVATFKSNSPISKTKYFAILRQDIDSVVLSLEGYYKKSITELTNRYEVTTQEHFLIKSGNEVSYFSIYSVVKEGEPILLLNFLTKVDNQIFDFAYSSLQDKEKLKKSVFSDIFQGCYINNVRILNPFKNITVTSIK